MGDAGALFLGVLIASLTIRLDPTPINDFAAFSVPFFLMAIPILDTSVAVTKRICRGISPFQGGRDHLSHRLMRLDMSKRRAVLVLWASTLFFGVLTLIISELPFSLEGIVALIGVIAWLWAFYFFAKQPDEA